MLSGKNQCYHPGVKQLIARLDDDLHRRLKETAESEGRSLNDLVAEALAARVGEQVTRDSVRERARATGRLLELDPPREAPSLDELEELTRGSGTAVSDALDVDRGDR